MFEIINDNELLSFSDIRKKYDGYLVLVKKEDRLNGYAYAISDVQDAGKIVDLQLKFNKDNIKTRQVNALTGLVDYSLELRKCELL